MRRSCSEHGFVEGERCPRCGDETYDLDDREDRAFLRTLVRQRRLRRWLHATGVGFLLAMMGLFGIDCAADLGMQLAARSDAMLMTTAALAVVLESILVLRLPREQREFERAVVPDLSLRRLLSVPALATVACIVVFVLTSAPHSVGMLWDERMVLEIEPDALLYAMHPLAIRDGRELVTLLTAGLLHAQLDHLLGNLMGLLVFGPAVDLRLGRPLCGLLLGLGIVAGNLAHAWTTATPEIPVVGISSGVFALAGCTLTLMPRRAMIYGPSGKWRVEAWVLIPVTTLGFGALMAALDPRIAWAAHLGGLLVGGVFGLLARRAPVPAAYVEAETIREQQVMG